MSRFWRCLKTLDPFSMKSMTCLVGGFEFAFLSGIWLCLPRVFPVVPIPATIHFWVGIVLIVGALFSGALGIWKGFQEIADVNGDVRCMVRLWKHHRAPARDLVRMVLAAVLVCVFGSLILVAFAFTLWKGGPQRIPLATKVSIAAEGNRQDSDKPTAFALAVAHAGAGSAVAVPAEPRKAEPKPVATEHEGLEAGRPPSTEAPVSFSPTPRVWALAITLVAELAALAMVLFAAVGLLRDDD